MKELMIKEYLSKISFKSPNWSIQKITSDMQRFLGEIPAIDVSYIKDVMVNEVSGESKEIKNLAKVSIIFTETDDKIKKLEILV